MASQPRREPEPEPERQPLARELNFTDDDNDQRAGSNRSQPYMVVYMQGVVRRYRL